MKAPLLLIALLFFYTGISQMPSGDPIPGDIIIRLQDANTDLSSLLTDVNKGERAFSAGLYFKKQLSATAGIYLLHHDHPLYSDEEWLSVLQRHPSVRYAQFNYPVSYRNDPNDPSLSEQWYLDVISAKEAWDITTGGVTAAGDTIVVALIDKGCDLDHIDIADNLWVNQAEIRGDGVDNDNNGYIDDYYGWRYDTDNDLHQAAAHGTQISGVIGAIGDNGKGIAGVNWNVRIMLLTMALNDADIIAACYYARDMRVRYQQSGGTAGAFVVSANFSFGFDYAWPVDHPGWCEAFDDLGEAGIVSTGATNNEAINVDVAGDIPSTCPSEYLIVVTNTTETDTKASGAAWGPLYVDMGAPGSNIHTTTVSNDYTDVTGTSFSAPMVAAAVALLYSLPSDEVSAIASGDPSTAAKFFRDLILEGAAKIPDLAEKTVTGGRLDLLGSIERAKTAIGIPVGDLDIVKIYPNPTDDKLLLEYQSPGLYEYLVRIYDASGRMLIEQKLSPRDAFSQPVEFDVSRFPSGVYTLTVHNFKQVVSSKFLVFPLD